MIHLLHFIIKKKIYYKASSIGIITQKRQAQLSLSFLWERYLRVNKAYSLKKYKCKEILIFRVANGGEDNKYCVCYLSDP